MKLRIALAAALSLAFPLVASADDAYTVYREIVFLHTNDLHSHLEGIGPDADYSPGTRNDDATLGGFARLAALVARERAAETAPNRSVMLLDAGDFSMGTLFHLLEPTHSPELTLLGELGCDATTLGNHEFDWGPAQTARIVGASDGRVPVLATNLAFDAANPGDDALAALASQGRIRRWMVKTLPNGLRVGIFGLMGINAATVVPQAAPVTFANPVAAAAEAVAALRAQGVDVVVALSHSGVTANPATSEDPIIATLVPGIDVIVSGHSHTLLTEPIAVPHADGRTTWIVQAGEFGQHLGRLRLRVFRTKVPEMREYESIPVDDTVAGDPGIQNLVEIYRYMISLAISPLSADQVLAETPFPVTRGPYGVVAESAMGNLVSDGMRAGASAATVPLGQRPVDFAFESSTLVRDPILPGKSGLIQVSDAFRLFPLGAGPDGLPGYPVVTFYLSAPEIGQILEASATLGTMISEDFFLQVSGLRYTWNPAAGPFQHVVSIDAGDELHGYQAFDSSPSNPTLYRVAANLFLSSFIAQLGPLSSGVLSIVPKDANGQPLASFAGAIVDRNPATSVLEEMKEWQALVGYLGALPDSDGDHIPNLPVLYAQPLGRIRTGTPSVCETVETIRD